MNSLLIASAFSVIVSAAPTATPKVSPNAQTLADKVQQFYDKLEDYQADFVQRYHRTALSKTSESSGTLTLKKGGKVRWSYEQPGVRLFIANGKTLWVYEPEEEQVIVDQQFSIDKLGGSLAFLWGKGQLETSFFLSIPSSEHHDFGKEAKVLELRPKTDQTYKRLVLKVDPESGRVEGTIVFETSGNTNRFEFTNPKINQGLNDALFEFVPPKGVEVVHARAS
ncbi:MAG: outer membrane lipoprotein chaperone LolA [Myxococcales bacterium]|nr:outer membrane lipoprotein chaperone LolA [Myxococcales bacterium]